MNPNAETKLGKIEGTERNGIVNFRGVPFAAAPVGDLRFAPPQPHPGWAGTRDATKIAPSAPQNSRPDALPGTEIKSTSEDCLYLNVWTPGTDNGQRPVMVWIHGGGFSQGSGTVPAYKGERLAAEGDVVTVTINYRLGTLGFLHLGDAMGPSAGSATETDSGCTNLGLRDQIAALEWVRDNIAAFGGNPANVTIFGESAGGMSVGTLLGAPSAHGLFHRAILQSGAAHNIFEPDDAREVAEWLLARHGLTLDEANKLRNIEIDEILKMQLAAEEPSEIAEAAESSRREGLLSFQPIADGSLIPSQPLDQVRSRTAANVPVMVGTTTEEFRSFAMMDSAMGSLTRERVVRRLERMFGFSDEASSALYDTYVDASADAGDSTSPDDIWLALARDGIFRIPAIRLAEAHAGAGRSAWVYEFGWKSPMLGAAHGMDVPFVFGNLGGPALEPFLGPLAETEDLSRAVRDAWVSFARDGRPSSEALPDWPQYDTDSRATMHLGAERQLLTDPAPEHREAWDGLL